MSKLYFEKNLLLQSLTLLFESALAFLENRAKTSFLKTQTIRHAAKIGFLADFSFLVVK